MTLDIPEGSIYFWMYNQGLKHVPWQQLEFELRMAGKEIRKKDSDNYWNGWHRSSLYDHGDEWTVRRESFVSASKGYFDKAWDDYEPHPMLDLPEPRNRFVPCNKANKPMIPWGEGCMTLVDAKAKMGMVYLAENLKGTKRIVVDCDGDHEEKLDGRTIWFLSKYLDKTHVLAKPKKVCEYEGYESTGIDLPASFHLTFMVDRLVPTMHFPKAHIDIAGNAKNQLRYFKNKVWNGLEPAPMTPEIWEDIKRYIEGRECGKSA